MRFVRVSSRWLLLLAAFVALLACALGCHREEAAEKPPPVPVVTNATTGMLFTWIDDKGEFHVEQRAEEVPVTARDAVRVTDPARPAPAGQIFTVDLRNARPDGTYAVHTQARAEFEAVAVARRKANGAVLVPGTAKPSPDGPKAAPAVIIYGASWCGPCHQAQAYLRKKGVPFVEKDIERDGSAAREMKAKLAHAGMRGGSIPVIDVHGKLLVGFDPQAIDRALSM